MTGVVDAHCHASLIWYEPVQALLAQLDRHQVDRAVLVQINGHYDNDYQMACVRRHPDRLASVVRVDPASPNAEAALEALAEVGVAGVRINAADRSPGSDPLALWRAAQRLGLPVSCGGRSAEFASREFRDVLAAVPELPVVIEHLAGANHPNEADTMELRRRAFGLAEWPRAYIKIHGFGEFADPAIPASATSPFCQPIPPLLEMACEAFGPARMMWGSDHPLVSAREGYGNALRFPRAALNALSPGERSRILAGTATELFFPRSPR